MPERGADTSVHPEYGYHYVTVMAFDRTTRTTSATTPTVAERRARSTNPEEGHLPGYNCRSERTSFFI
jgi:hypothetical protein